MLSRNLIRYRNSTVLPGKRHLINDRKDICSNTYPYGHLPTQVPAGSIGVFLPVQSNKYDLNPPANATSAKMIQFFC